MKGLMAKLKGMPIKSILMTHGEKFVFGTVGLMVLLALVSTTWGGYQKQPDELLTKATAAGTALHTGAWPEERQGALKPSTYQAMATSMFDELNMVDSMSPFSYDKPMSFPIYAREEPDGEPEWPSAPQDLIADASVMVLGVNPPLPTEEELAKLQEEANALQTAPLKAAGATKKGGKTKDDALAGSAAMMPPAMGAGGMGGGLSTGMQPRGQRFVAVRGIVNLFDIGRAIQKALHLETPAEGMALIEVIDFKIQRQKAIAGPNPWPDDSWQDVSLDRADEVLSESEQAADLVTTECINPVFTMPLPTRLDGDYTKIVSHPSLERFELSKEQRAMEQKLNSALMESAGEMGLEEQAGKRRGFLKDQVDIGGLRSNFMGAGGNMGDVYRKAGITTPAAAGGAGGMMPQLSGPRPSMGGPMAGGPRPGAGGMQMPGMQHPGGPGMMGGQGGMVAQVGGAAAGYLMLFRYLDFDVNPGEAYRYRVQLEFANPNYGVALDKIKEASVAEGETRLTEWSQPSAPVVVKSDSNLFLTEVDKRPRAKGEAKIHAYQWDPSLGTYIDSKMVAKFGQFLGGLAPSVRLDLGVPSYQEKQVLFATKDFLLDTALPPAIIPADNPDLNLVVDSKQPKDGLEMPSEAIVLDEYGQLKVLDSITQKPMADEVKKKVDAEREPWKYLEETGEPKDGLNSLDPAAAGPGGGMMMPSLGGPTSALKRGKGGKAGKAGAGAGAMTTMPGPGGPGTTGKGKGKGPR
ncbi:MAG: hypothetical protein JWN70_6227 [Planctomycetaceae bacterium]|nr:hypothetical protein [Planctomycetaceae bacterium]